MDSLFKLLELSNQFPYYKQANWSKDVDSGNIPYLGLTLVFTTVVFLFEFYLDSRQLHKFRTEKKLPKELQKAVPEDKFKSSNSYCADKLSFGKVEASFMFVEGIVLVLMGWMPFIWDVAQQFCNNYKLIDDSSSPMFQEVVITCVFAAILMVHDTLISLPFSLYSTFVIEQKHGFNKSTLALYFRDKVVSLAITIVIGFPVLAAVIWLVRMGGANFYFYVWFFLCVISIIMMIVYPTFIAPLFNTYTKLDEGPIYTAIEKLANQVSFPLTEIYVVDGSKRSSHSNAYFYGFFGSKRIVLFDTLLKQVEMSELLAILGHEIGHWKLWHTMQGFVISQVYIFALFLSFSFVQNTPGLFADFGFAYTSPMPVLIGLTLFMQTAWSPVDKVLTIMVNINSRANEFAADKYAATLGMGDGLATGLIKISIENLGNMVPDSLYSLYHFSHPPVVERIAAIKNYKELVSWLNPSLKPTSRQHRDWGSCFIPRAQQADETIRQLVLLSADEVVFTASIKISNTEHSS